MAMTQDPFICPLSRQIWQNKYRFAPEGGVPEPSIADTWRRVARHVAQAEGADAARWQDKYFALLQDFRFLPGGRILAGAGTDRQVTLFNCFVMGLVDDSLDGIFDALKEGALTMQQGGGVGYDFSTLRPRGSRVRKTGAVASGPVSFMRIWDAMCATLLSTGARRGAMMATLRCDHPDIEEFVDAKRDAQALRHFNLSVLVSDEFLDAVREDRPWPLVFPLRGALEREGEVQMRAWSGHIESEPCAVWQQISARTLWHKIMRSAYDSAEPGVLFIDRINRENNLYYRESLSATNPCGELPLPAYGACDLGSLNLTRFVKDPFSASAQLDFPVLAESTWTAVRFLDDVIDVSRFPLAVQAAQVRSTRRIGLGITGLADALIMLGLAYDSDAGRTLAQRVMTTVCHEAYRASAALAVEKSAFPAFESRAFSNSEFVQRLPQDIRDAIQGSGLRNSHLTAIAPTGTISLLANNISSGLEPVFAPRYRRRLLEAEGSQGEHDVVDYALACWEARGSKEPLPAAFVTAHQLAPEAHLAMQAALQPYVDSAISKTINVPAELPFAEFVSLYERAYALGLKGCTVFRPNPIRGAVLTEAPPTDCQWCGTEREAD